DEACVIGCENDTQCLTANGPLNFCGPDGQCKAGCKKNAECIAKNGPNWTCVKETNTCQNLLPSECYQVLSAPANDLSNDDIIFVGYQGAFPPGGTGAPNYASLEGAELARQEFMSLNGGVTLAGKKHPVAFVVCDTVRNVDLSMQQLFALHVPGVVGPQNTGV